MTGYHKKLFFALLLGAMCYFPGAGRIHAQAQQQKPKPQVQQPAEQQEEYTEEEYDAYEKATKEPDPGKRVDMLLAFIEKWPKSKLMNYIVSSYQTTLFELDKSGNYAKLEPAAEHWLKLHPDDLQMIVYVATATEKLGNDKKYLEFAQKIFAVKPVPELAASIQATYKKIGDQAKYEEWTEKLFTFPEYAGDFGLRYVFVEKYDKAKNLPKAAEYAHLTLKSLDVAKKPDNKSEAEWRTSSMELRKTCWMVIAMNDYEKKKWDETIKALDQASKVDPTFEKPYYYIGQCLWHQSKIEEAIQYFAMAELSKGDMKAQAKEKVETLYKPLHNQTIIGIDKVYKKAADELANRKKP